MTGLLALAFGAGLLAPVNPCGFGLLPAMLTATLGPARPGAPHGLVPRLAGGLLAGLALTLGFTAAFTLIGVGLTLGVRSLIIGGPLAGRRRSVCGPRWYSWITSGPLADCDVPGPDRE